MKQQGTPSTQSQASADVKTKKKIAVALTYEFIKNKITKKVCLV